MKHIKTKIYSLLVLFLLSISMQAQDIRTTTTKIADILAQMPAKSNEQLNKVLVQTLSLKDEGISGMLQMLKPAGQGDDVAVRFTLTSLARYCSQKGHEGEWSLVQQNFLRAIDTFKDKEIQAYLIHQLNYGANEGVVDPLKKYLADERLAEPVTQLFLNVRTPKVEQVFFEALKTSNGRNQVTFVKALGELHVKTAVAEISKLANSQNKELQRSVLAALANIGDAQSYNIIWSAAQKSSFKYEPTEATASFLKYCDQLGKNKDIALCKQGCLAIIASNSEKDLLHNKAAAIAIYSRYFPKEAMAIILKEVDNADSSYRMAVLNTARALGDESYTQKWIKKAKGASVNTQADIIYMLGNRNDKSAVPFVQKSLQDNSSKVRRMAIWALVKLDPAIAEKELLNYLALGNETSEAEYALKTLLDEKKLDQVVSKLPNATNAGKVGLLNMIASKNGKRFFSQVYSYTQNEDAAIRTAAISALKSIASFNNIDELLKLLAKTSDEKDIKELQLALINAANENDDSEKASEPLLKEFQNASLKEKLLPVLSALGSRNALKEVAATFNNSNGSLQQTSLKALVNWENADAAPYLLQICKTGNSAYRADAFQGYVDQVSGSNLPNDQKLLKLQMIMPLAQTNEEKESVINSLADVKTFLSLVYVGKYLDDAALQQAAADAVAQIALPQSDARPGFYGDIPKTLVQKAMDIMSGPESAYTKENMKRYLENMPQGPGFVSMFNGVDLTGWKGFVTDPIKLAKLTPKELEKLQKKANEKMHFNWKVQDGMIVFNGEGDNLLSDKEYGDFEMIVNWKISKKGDSGIYLRGTPQVQIWDTTRVDVGAQVGSGGLYNNQKNMSKPLKVADNPIEDWNTFRITMIGEKVTVYLNGELVVDNVPLENYWDRNLPIFPKGTIELQAHGTDLAFKDIYVREIKDQEITLTSEEKNQGFVTLFNGKNLDGWVGNKKDYKAEGGNIIIQPSEGAGGGNLYTEKEYSDFVFRFEFQLTPGANNGL
ncbi:MAG TPA: family 16 glycoside hydrolase, partial [Bacteroidales bacterium]|nr:family 16 glycoside hydrolase [Bacteroidales bacterium]